MTKYSPKQLARETARMRASRLIMEKPVIMGTLVTSLRTCGTKSCRCHHDGPKHSATYFSIKDGKKRTTVFVPQSVMPYVRRCVSNYQSLQKTLDIISRDCVEIFLSKKRNKNKKIN